MKALKEGIENKYYWNVEASGAQRPYRIMQKRGAFVDAEDFLPVRDTYEPHPISKVIPTNATLTDLTQKRKVEEKVNISNKLTNLLEMREKQNKL